MSGRRSREELRDRRDSTFGAGRCGELSWRNATLVLLVAALAACGADPVADKLAEFDPAEAQAIRDDFEREGWTYSEESVLGILVGERECRQIRAALADLAAGSPVDEIADHLDEVLVVQNEVFQPDMAVYFQGVVDELRSGSPTNIQEYLELNCEYVQ